MHMRYSLCTVAFLAVFKNCKKGAKNNSSTRLQLFYPKKYRHMKILISFEVTVSICLILFLCCYFFVCYQNSLSHEFNLRAGVCTCYNDKSFIRTDRWR